jgi:hypothetical protein
MVKSDDNGGLGSLTGWTIGTYTTTTTGTDASFQTAHKENVSASTTSDTTFIFTPAQGRYQYYGISFKPSRDTRKNRSTQALQAAKRGVM